MIAPILSVPTQEETHRYVWDAGFLDWVPETGTPVTATLDGYPVHPWVHVRTVFESHRYVWDSVGLAWVPETPA